MFLISDHFYKSDTSKNECENKIVIYSFNITNYKLNEHDYIFIQKSN